MLNDVQKCPFCKKNDQHIHITRRNILRRRFCGIYLQMECTLSSETFCIARSRSDDALLRYDHLKFSKMAAGRHLEFDPTGNGAIRSAVPENPTLEPNMKGMREYASVSN